MTIKHTQTHFLPVGWGENWKGKRAEHQGGRDVSSQKSQMSMFYMMSCANTWHAWTWIPAIPRPKRSVSTWWPHSVLLFCALLKGTPLWPCLQGSTGLGLGLSTAVVQILTKREHTICYLYLQHAIYGVATHSPSLWTLFTAPVWVASLRDVDAFLTPTGLWGVLGSDILNLNLACCLPAYTSLPVYTWERKSAQKRNKALFFSLEHQSKQARGNEVEMECNIWGKGFSWSFLILLVTAKAAKGETLHNSFITLWCVK